MDVIDYSSLLYDDTSRIYAAPVSGLYERGDGVQFRSTGRHHSLISEVSRVGDGSLLLAGDYAPVGAVKHRQIVSEENWIHLQFRYSAGGTERIGSSAPTELQPRSCVISQYLNGTEVVRDLSGHQRLTHVCLYVTERGLAGLLNIPTDQLQRTPLGQLLAETPREATTSIPLAAPMITAGQEVLSCPLQGISRRIFMRAKSIELLSSVLTTLQQRGSDPRNSLVDFSSRELRQVLTAQELIARDLRRQLTLQDVAGLVGLSRTKFATSFKAITGVTMHEFLRDLRLIHAYKALTTSDISVTQAAYDVGYSEVSSFSKAFYAKFGLLPRNCKRQRAHC